METKNFSTNPEVMGLYAKLNVAVVEEESVYRHKKYAKLSSDEKREKKKLLAREVQKLRNRLSVIRRKMYNIYQSPLAVILPDRSKDELIIAENILNNDQEFPYKTAKIRAFVVGGLITTEIERVMAERHEYSVTAAYIEALIIKEELNNGR